MRRESDAALYCSSRRSKAHRLVARVDEDHHLLAIAQRRERLLPRCIIALHGSVALLGVLFNLKSLFNNNNNNNNNNKNLMKNQAPI